MLLTTHNNIGDPIIYRYFDPGSGIKSKPKLFPVLLDFQPDEVVAVLSARLAPAFPPRPLADVVFLAAGDVVFALYLLLAAAL